MCLLDMYHWVPVLAMTRRMRDIGQNILQSSFQTESSSSHNYFQISFLIAFLEEDFISKIIIILCITYLLT